MTVPPPRFLSDATDQPIASLQGFPLEAWIKWKFSKPTGAVRANEAPGAARTGRDSVDHEEPGPSKPLKAAAVEALSSPSEQWAAERTVDVLRDAKGAEGQDREKKREEYVCTNAGAVDVGSSSPLSHSAITGRCSIPRKKGPTSVSNDLATPHGAYI